MQPRVAVVIPTTQNREYFNQRIQDIYHYQDYENKQCIMIFGDGSIGSKLNSGIRSCSADIIVRFDSDDLYAPDYITKCVDALHEADTTGLNAAFFYRKNPSTAWLWEYGLKSPYVIGSGMAFWKRIWHKNQFDDISHGEDRHFMRAAGKVAPHGYIQGFLASIHDDNTASHLSINLMKQVSVDYMKSQIKIPILEKSI